MRALGFIFVSLVIAAAVVSLDYALPGDYLNIFLDDHFIETFAALVGFNLAGVIFLVGQLLVIEGGRDFAFENTRREIKHNAYFLLSSFGLSLLLLIFRPNFIESVSVKQNLVFYTMNVLILTLFTLVIFAIFEILQAVFRIKPSN